MSKVAIISFLWFSLTGCAQQTVELSKALIQPSHVKQSVEIEKELNARSEIFAPEGERWFAVLRGETPILVVAPHATCPTREGSLRFSDGGATGAMTVMLHELNGVTAIHTTYASPSDPNYYDDNEFKEEVAALISEIHPVLVLDIHGSHWYRPYDVDFGTMHGRSLLGNKDILKWLAEALENEGIFNLSQDYFAAEKNQTITKWVSARGVPCIQVEISSTWLTPSSGNLNAHRYSQLLQALTRFIERVAAELK